MTLPSDLLLRPRREAVRRIALEQLEAARLAARRLDQIDDAEALHDFRVALRRLRSILSSWKRALRGRVQGTQRRALRAVQGATGAGRDAEVALEWLARQRPDLSPSERPGCDQLAEDLRARLSEAMSHAREGVRDAFEIEYGILHDRLSGKDLESDKKGRFRRALRRATRRHADRLSGLLSGETVLSDEEQLHRARIAVKRLRYLLEPVRAHAPTAIAVVRATKRLQDLLGRINDMHVHRRELALRLEALSGRADEQVLRAGLEELRRRAALSLAALEDELRKDWIADDLELLQRPLRLLRDELRAP